MVLPLRPEGTEGWDEEALRTLVNRDSMIGVRPATPADESVLGTGGASLGEHASERHC